ncbi:LysR family transcriptional regulator, partial [Xanthomonas sp. Kuri4-2]
MRGELGEYADGLRATVRLLANTAALGEWLPELLAQFLVAHPRIDLALIETGSEDAVAALREDAADLAVVAGHAALDGLQVDAFRQDRLVLVVPVGHSLAAAPGTRLAALLDQDFIGLPDDSALQRHLQAQAALLGARLRLRAQVQGVETVCRMVACGAGVAILPEAAARRSSVRERLAQVPLEDAWAP